MQHGALEIRTGYLSRNEGFSRQLALPLALRKKLRTLSSLQAAAGAVPVYLVQLEFRVRFLACRGNTRTLDSKHLIRQGKLRPALAPS